MTFVLNPRHDDKDLKVKIDISDQLGGHMIDFHNAAMVAKPSFHASWILKRKLDPGIYLVRVAIDGNRAHESMISLEDTLF